MGLFTRKPNQETEAMRMIASVLVDMNEQLKSLNDKMSDVHAAYEGLNQNR